MARPRKSLSPARDTLVTQYRAGTPIAELLRLLREQYNVEISAPTLQRRLREWMEPPRQQRTQDTPEVRSVIREEFFIRDASDAEIIERLRSLGLPISPYGLLRIRQDLGIYRKRTPEQLEAQIRQAVDFMTTPSLSQVLIPRLGRRSLWKHFLQVAQIPIPQHALYEAFSQLFPEEVARRWQQMRAKRSGFTVPGPNYTWPIDAYCKLQDYGIEIYAGIDAYSRCIVWCYVGISALTARSVFAQYLKIVRHLRIIPMVIRSDRGTETVMVAAAHFWLSQATSALRRLRPRRNRNGGIDWYMPDANGGPDVWVDLDTLDSDAPLYGPERPFEFGDCWVYGKSTKNQRIESWWSQLAKGRSWFWIEWFGQLRRQDLWSKDRLADQIALLWTYMPQIRFEMETFVQYWNNHNIRKQSSRPHVVTGSPIKMFEQDAADGSAVNCALPLPEDRWEALNNLAELDGLEMDAYLPAASERLCDQIIEGYEGPREMTAEYPYFEGYQFLRDRLAAHERRGDEPRLCLLERPVGGWDVFQAKIAEMGINIHDLEHLGGEELVQMEENEA